MAVIEHCPPTYHNIDEGEPGIFLAGPIQGAPDWQNEAYLNLTRVHRSTDNIHVFSPRRRDNFENQDRPEFAKNRKLPDEVFKGQVDWEKRHLKIARDTGVLVFWFAARDYSLKYREGRPYTQTTRLELSRTFGWLDYSPKIEVVAGMDPNYEGSNTRYVKELIAEFAIPLHDNLEEVCVSALKTALGKKALIGG